MFHIQDSSHLLYCLTARVTSAFPISCAHCCIGDDSHLMGEKLGQKGRFQAPFSNASAQ